METPPQMRGISVPVRDCRQPRRNTPADAGNLHQLHRRPRWIGKHPRRCGESRGTIRGRNTSLETPPQMRGIWSRMVLPRRSARNTPADAGNLKRTPGKHHRNQKHPRRCGESLKCELLTDVDPETPPQMRGIFDAVTTSDSLSGNTPADAGNLRYMGALAKKM